jgi:molecular chaperone DnaK (HSP70)
LIFERPVKVSFFINNNVVETVAVRMKHKHHIIPRHMGGTDDPSNLIELTVEEHAEAHRKLWEQYGNIKDYCAWKGLEGTIGKEEIVRLLMDPTGRVHTEETKQKISEAHKGKSKHTEESKEKLRQFRTGMKLSEEHKAKISKGLEGNTNMVGRKLSEDTKKKISEAGKGNKNASKNPNISEEERKRRSEATKERWKKYREEKGLDPNKPIDGRYSKI